MELLKKISFVFISVLFGVIPFYQKGVLSMLIGLLVIVTLFQLNRNRKVEWVNVFMSGFGLFLILALSLFWTEDLPAGLKSMETKLSLFFLPLIFGFLPPLNPENKERILWILVTSMGASVIYYVIKACVKYLEEYELDVFFYGELSPPLHASYLAMYYTVAVAVILIHFLCKTENRFHKVFLNVLLILCMIGISLLSTKSGFLACSALFLFSFCLGLLQKSKRKLIYVSPIYFVLLLSSVWLNPTAKNRISKAIQIDLVKEEKELEEDLIKKTERSSTESRLIIWSLSAQLILENPWGVGEGDVREVIYERYLKEGEYYVASKRYNSHNQFFETALSSGIIALVFLLGMFIYFLIRSIYTKDWLFMGISLVFFINLMTESMFQRESGVVFIILILSFLIFNNSRSHPPTF